MSEIPKISEAEWEVMKIFGPRLFLVRPMKLLKLKRLFRLEAEHGENADYEAGKKGRFGFREKRRIYRYYPLLTEDQCVRSETKSFLKRVFSGALKPMLVTFLQEEKLSRKKLRSLSVSLKKGSGENGLCP